MKINYNKLAVSYENTREIEPLIYSILCYILKPTKNDLVLEFGCGTGNYLKQLTIDYGLKPYGVEPSENMRLIAQNKLKEANIKAGTHSHIPFENNFFRKVYCVDVIHHISHLNELFHNLKNVSSDKAQLCICTESPKQLEVKFWLKYFESLLKEDSKRFHSIESIISSGINTGWIFKEVISVENELDAPISSNFVERIEQKSLSVLHLIPQEEYEQGLYNMMLDYKNQVIIHQHEGYTFIIFERG